MEDGAFAANATKGDTSSREDVNEQEAHMSQDVKLEKHQADATRLFAVAVTNQLPIVMVECQSKLVPDEKVRVLAVSFTDAERMTTILVPVARLFEDAPMVSCYKPNLRGVTVEHTSVVSPFDEEMNGWKLQLNGQGAEYGDLDNTH